MDPDGYVIPQSGDTNSQAHLNFVISFIVNRNFSEIHFL